jgi:hypothetical protein
LAIADGDSVSLTAAILENLPKDEIHLPTGLKGAPDAKTVWAAELNHRQSA